MSNRSFVQTAAVIGSEVVPVLVECDISEGPPSCTILGVERDYADALAAITRCAVKSCYFEWPRRPVIVSLTPLDKITHGAHLLLPIACAVLSATGQVKMPEKVLAIGEVGLGGHLVHETPDIGKYAAYASSIGRELLCSEYEPLPLKDAERAFHVRAAI